MTSTAQTPFEDALDKGKSTEVKTSKLHAVFVSK